MNKISIQIGERLFQIREKLGLNQTFFAKKLNLLTQTYSRYEKGERDLPDSVKIILRESGVNIDWLLTGEGEMFRGETKEVSQTYAKIPLLRQRVSCGPGKNWEDSDAVETYIEPLCLIPSFRNKNIYAFRAEGLSMVGAGIHDGDIVLFDAGSNAPEDDIYVFAWEGNVFCKLLKFNEFEHIINVYSVHSKEIDKAELLKKLDMNNPEVIDNFRLFGRVLGWIHENRLVRH